MKPQIFPSPTGFLCFGIYAQCRTASSLTSTTAIGPQWGVMGASHFHAG